MIEYILFPLNNFLWIISDLLTYVVTVLGAAFALIVIVTMVSSALLCAVYYLSEEFYYKRKRNGK